MADFWIYSTDASPETSPLTGTYHAKLDDAPILNGEYDNFGDYPGRGSVHRTLGGIVIQDFGVNVVDRTIKLSGVDALLEDTVTAIKTMHDIAGGQYYFSDGYERFKVQFSRDPAGFRFWLSYPFARFRKLYSYEINLLVLEKRA
jgi:hypothetical protein